MALQSNYYPVPIVAGTTAGTYAAGDDPRLSDERTPSDDVVTNAKLANVATATIKGRATAGTGDPEDLTASQVRTILNVADGAEVNVQSNWTEADSGSDAFILNKPSIPTASSATPQALGVAAAGTSSDFARADHVHAMPTAADVGAAPSTGIDPTAITGTAVVDSDARLSDSRTPTAHAASHASAGSDPLAPSDIGAQSVFEIISVTASSDTTLTASRAARYNILNFTGTALNITLPTNNIITGDVAIISSPVMTGAGTLVIRRQNADLSYTTLATITKSLSSGSGETFRFYTVGSNTQDWRLDVVPNHGSTHASNGSDPLSLAASQITSGTLAHERGGLEADVSAYNGLLKIASGSTSAVTVTAAGEALLDDADASAQRTTLGLGNSATLDTGTTAGTVAEGDHTHADLHTRSHAITSTSDHTAGNHKVFYSNGSGEIVELALGNSGEVLTSNGATSAPSFAAASGGGATLMQSIAVGFVLN